ncbi:hypothetical protein MAPG_03233 [Magnaporthiopsis poae ATCC 64411]|uniref:Uncharacterized protein n=1 Tax=Magnaporthiopsis poae (strain ATCC 64411 / 73-15) TaxID=644358 RepID=A0A0C4DTG6_MAGP6|nr:hypothetical protein MAPG_03233 [Magnaporthiopsis poae ATCC 64411]
MSDAPCLEQTCSGSGGDDQVPKSKAGGRAGRLRVLSQLKSWITVSEPSAQAFKQHQKESYNRAGVSRDDPTARTKLRAPTGSIPQDAIKPSGKGPDPEDVVRIKAAQTRALRQACSAVSTGSRASQTYSSRSSSSFGSTASAAASSTFSTPGGK